MVRDYFVATRDRETLQVVSTNTDYTSLQDTERKDGQLRQVGSYDFH
jgi:hypothetical protein